MKYKNSVLFLIGFALACFSAGMTSAAQTNQATASTQARRIPGLEKEVRHELAMLPYYTRFDAIEYKIEGDKVTLSGWVTRPTLKSDAENVLKQIEGVESINNRIEVLPLSPNDDRIRRALFYALFGWDSPLYRYAVGSADNIRMIVRNGNVILVGQVATDFERNIAEVRANQVPGVFSVTNKLAVRKEKEE